MMQFGLLTLISGCLLAVQGRDSGKPSKSLPTITGSLVNLGRMDISVHFNGKEHPQKMTNRVSPFLFPTETIREDCPCSSLRSMKDSPSDLLHRILKSSDLFSFNREPVSSSICCDSNEPIREDIVTFEIEGSRTPILDTYHNVPKWPLNFENFYPKKQMMPILSKPVTILPMFSYKPKLVDTSITLYPKEKQSLSVAKKQIKKEDLQIVGDKEIRNDFKTMKPNPSAQNNFQYSVKKDLTAQEKNKTKKQKEKEEIEVTTSSAIIDNIIL